MTTASAPAAATAGAPLVTRDARVTFYLGGGLFVLAGICGLGTLGPLSGAVYEVLGDDAVVVQTVGRVLFSAAMIVFAIGGPRGGSVVARKPLGLTALLVAALWPLVTAISDVTTMLGIGPEIGYFVWPAIEIAVGLIAVIEIVRIRAVPGWARWIPLILFVVYEALSIAPQIMMRVLPPMAWHAPPYMVIYVPFILLWLAAPFILGIAAIVLALRASTKAGRAPAPEARAGDPDGL